MFFETGAYNIRTAYLLAQMLGQLPGANAQAAIDALFRADTGQAPRSFMGRGNPACPDIYFAAIPGNTLLLINHTENLQMALDIYNGYIRNPQLLINHYDNDWARTAAAAIVNFLNQNHVGFPQPLWIAGHSIGGVLADYVADLYLTQGLGYQPVRISFGAPKSGWPRFYNNLGANFGVRWMNEDDAVPLIPPNTFPANTIFGLNLPPCMRQAANYVHGLPGISLSPTGIVSAAILPPRASLRPSISMASWLLNCTGDVGTFHPMSVYVERLRAAIALITTPATEDVHPSTLEQQNPVTVNEANQAARQAETAVFVQGAQQNQQPPNVPQQDLAFAFRTGGVWQVAWGNTILACSPTKRRARHFANVVNQFLLALSPQAVVDADALVQQLGIYLQLAQDPTSGITPTINTQWPT